MEKNYHYPLDYSWSKDEIVIVMEMWAKVEEAYEKGVALPELMATYKSFKTVVRSIGEERSLGREFEEMSGYSLYHVMKAAREQSTGKLKM